MGFFSGLGNALGQGIQKVGNWLQQPIGSQTQPGGVENSPVGQFSSGIGGSFVPDNNIATAPKINPDTTPMLTAQGITGAAGLPQTSAPASGNYTLNGTTYNQQGEIVNGPGSNAQNGQVNTATSSITPANLNGEPTGTQTYKMNDGSIYDGAGNLVSKPGSNVQTTAGPNISAESPDTQTNSGNLGQSPTNSAILSSLADSYANEQNLFNNLGQFAQVGPAEQALQGEVAQGQAKITGLQEQEQGLYNPGNQTIALPFLTGQAQNQMVSAQLQQTINTAMLAYAQGNREFAFNSANQIYDASRNNLTDMISIYQASAPKNVATNYNPLTGAVNTTMINPLSGETYEVANGNIGASQPIQNVSTQVNPLNGQLTVVGTGANGQPVNYSLDSNGVITGSSLQGNATGNSLVSPNINPQAVIGGYDLTSYAGASSATGSYGQDVNSIYQNMPTISNAQDAQSYIGSVSPNSPITGQMVMSAAQQYGVNPNVMMAVMQKESSMGTAGMATSTFNPGNVGNNSDTGKQTNYGSWQTGVNALAHNLSERQLNPQQASTGSTLQNAASPQEVIQQVVSSLPPQFQNPGTVKYLPDGTPYLDGNNIDPTQRTMAQVIGSKTGIPYVDPDSANKLNTISTTQKDLQDFQTKADASLSSAGWGAQYLNYAGLAIAKLGGGTSLNDFQSFRTSAIGALESLASGSGTGFRITQQELNTAIDNVPTATDTKAQADIKIADLNSQMNNWVSTILPGWIPPQ